MNSKGKGIDDHPGDTNSRLLLVFSFPLVAFALQWPYPAAPQF